jgi:hypothetical protein
MEPALVSGLQSAPRETRTPTDHTVHKALNLARLPIPPQARAAPEYRAGRRPLEGVRRGLYILEHMFGSAQNPGTGSEA